MANTTAKIERILIKCDTTNGILTPGETVQLADAYTELEDRFLKAERRVTILQDELQAAYGAMSGVAFL